MQYKSQEPVNVIRRHLLSHKEVSFVTLQPTVTLRQNRANTNGENGPIVNTGSSVDEIKIRQRVVAINANDHNGDVVR